MIIKCDNCGKKFNKDLNQIKRSATHYCCKECRINGRIMKETPTKDVNIDDNNYNFWHPAAKSDANLYIPYIPINGNKHVITNPNILYYFNNKSILKKAVYDNFYYIDQKTFEMKNISQLVFKAYLGNKLVNRFRIKNSKRNNNLRIKLKDGLLVDAIKLECIKYYN